MFPTQANTQGQTKAAGRTAASLQEKIAKLEPGKVLDVSKITPTGTGVTSIKRPTTTKSTKYGGPTLPIVSADMEHYLIAIDQLPGGRAQYAAEIESVQAKFANGPRSPKSPKTVAALALPGKPFPGALPVPTVTIPFPTGKSPVLPTASKGKTSPILAVPIIPAMPTTATIQIPTLLNQQVPKPAAPTMQFLTLTPQPPATTAPFPTTVKTIPTVTLLPNKVTPLVPTVGTTTPTAGIPTPMPTAPFPTGNGANFLRGDLKFDFDEDSDEEEDDDDDDDDDE